MEKNSYETYEFLASTNSDSDSNQFFVLQDDGTILTVNKEIQYITKKIENDEDATGNSIPTEGCPPALDVPSQQYYIEIEGNPPQMICLNDQFAITNGENNVYTNSYLIQPENTIQQMETETLIDPQTLDAHQLQQLNVEAFNGTKQTTDLTEITLTDEQYQILEQKGWLLLESNDKIFVLNTLGLHDITANDKLIQRLKNELQESGNTSATIGELRIESVSSMPNENGDITTQDQGNMVEYFIANNVPIQQLEAVENVEYIVSENVKNETIVDEIAPKQMPDPSETNVVKEVPMSYKIWNNGDINSEAQKKCDSIKIKTKYIFKDIPEKIFLGKTVNGKKLFAKVKKKINVIHEKKHEIKTHHSSLMEGTIFTNLVQESFRRMSKTSSKNVGYAQVVVSQLLRLPNMKHSLVGNNLVVTKVVTSHTASGKDVGQPTMVTGIVQHLDGEETFIHSPLLLQELMREAEEKSKTPTDPISSCPEEKTARGVVDLLHIHISETRYTDKPHETSINLSERKLPLDVLTDTKKRHPNPAYACGTCGAVFNSEMQLKDHQDDECIEVEDELTIDTDDFNGNISTLYSVIENGKEKVYSCTICETKFTRLFNCKKHIKAHRAGIEKKLKAYKCKMCPNTYFHSASLSKHIVKTHIQMKLKDV